MKLTEAQKDWLKRFAIGGCYHVRRNIAVRNLELQRLVETNAHGCTCITEAGRTALEEQDGR